MKNVTKPSLWDKMQNWKVKYKTQDTITKQYPNSNTQYSNGLVIGYWSLVIACPVRDL
jgi:hypothetical protein